MYVVAAIFYGETHYHYIGGWTPRFSEASRYSFKLAQGIVASHGYGSILRGE